jgi:hypothetical protein
MERLPQDVYHSHEHYLQALERRNYYLKESSLLKKIKGVEGKKSH